VSPQGAVRDGGEVVVSRHLGCSDSEADQLAGALRDWLVASDLVRDEVLAAIGRLMVAESRQITDRSCLVHS